MTRRLLFVFFASITATTASWISSPVTHPSISMPKIRGQARRLQMVEPSSSTLVHDLTTNNLAWSNEMKTTLMSLAQQGGAPAIAAAVAFSDTVPLLPTQPVSILAGAVLGLGHGLPAVVFGQAVATIFAMAIGRFVLKDRFSADDTETDGDPSKLALVLQELTSGLNSGKFQDVFWTILLARQSPVLPFSVGNYFVGASTEAPLFPAVLATMVGCLPLNFVWVAAGAGGRQLLTVGGAQAAGLAGGAEGGLETIGLLATTAMVLSVGDAIQKVYSSAEGQQSTSP